MTILYEPSYSLYPIATTKLYDGISTRTIIHSGNYNTYLDGSYVKKSGDVMTGTLEVPMYLKISAESGN